MKKEIDYVALLQGARKVITAHCKCCLECNGKGCLYEIPGPGAKGDVAVNNYLAWKKGIHGENKVIQTKLFGTRISYPLIVGPIGGVKLHYGVDMTDDEYNTNLVKQCYKAGIIASVAGLSSCTKNLIKKYKGYVIPTIKPYERNKLYELIREVDKCKPVAFAIDIDACGLPQYAKELVQLTPEDLFCIAHMTDVPFIVKGVMDKKTALSAIHAGAKAIVISNHGGRIKEKMKTTYEALLDITEVIDKRCLVIVDGGIRDKESISKALSLGADYILIARPFVVASLGDKTNGVKRELNHLFK